LSSESSFIPHGWRLAVAAALVGLVLGCVSPPKPLSAEGRLKLAGSSAVDVIDVRGASFVSTQTARTGAYGLLGPGGSVIAEAAAATEGQRMMREYSLEDPALRVADGLASVLRDDLGVAQVRFVASSAGPTQYAPLVLSVQTVNWRMIYYMTNLNRYRLILQAQARLVHAQDAQPVWESVCWVQDEEPDTSPTLAELEANQGELLRSKSALAADTCVAQFRAALLGESDPPK
jgi:hypothetical protein